MRALFRKFMEYLRIRGEAADGIRCNFCLELYTGLAQDCACTNWGGFIGI